MFRRIVASSKFWKTFTKFLILGFSLMILLAGVSQSGAGLGLVSAETSQSPDAGGVNPPSVNPPPVNPPPVAPPPAAPTPSVCTEEPRQYNQCGAPAGSCANHPDVIDFSHTVVVAKNVDASCNVSFLCTDLGVRPGECNNPPTPAQPAPPAAPAAQTFNTCKGPMTFGFLVSELQKANYPGPFDISNVSAMIAAFDRAACPAAAPAPAVTVTTAGATCFLCDGGTLRKAGMQSDCNGFNNACPSIAGPGNVCLSTTDVTGQSCGAQPTPTPTPAPTATPTPGPTATPAPGPTATPAPAAAAAAEAESVAGAEATNNSTNNNTNNNSQSQTVNVSQGAPVAAGVPTVIVAAAPAGQAPTVTTLPKTGLPLLAWAAAAFIPAGFRLKKFNKGTTDANEANPHFIAEEREFKRS